MGTRFDSTNDSWFRRLPSPQDSGKREHDDYTGLSKLSIYIHALNFTVNTVSHVAIGDMTSINTEERFFNAFIIWAGTFIYAFLFGNVASIMSDFAPQLFFNFHKRYHQVMTSVKRGQVNKQISRNIRNYYDFIWANSKGFSQEEILGDLP